MRLSKTYVFLVLITHRLRGITVITGLREITGKKLNIPDQPRFLCFDIINYHQYSNHIPFGPEQQQFTPCHAPKFLKVWWAAIQKRMVESWGGSLLVNIYKRISYEPHSNHHQKPYFEMSQPMWGQHLARTECQLCQPQDRGRAPPASIQIVVDSSSAWHSIQSTAYKGNPR